MKKLASFVFVLMLSIGCSKNFVDLQPISTVSIDVLYKTDKDYVDALTATYNTLQDQYRSFYIFGDIRGDDAWQEIVKNNAQSYADAFVITSAEPLINTAWGNYYRLIARVNLLLAKIESADPAQVKGKDRYKAEARFLRAMAYFDLVRIFGKVPKITTPLSVEDAYKVPREEVDKLYQELIIPDLMAAETGLLRAYTGTDVGRPTIGAAKALLGKVYLTIRDFPKAEAKLQEVTTLGYALLPKFTDLFDYSKDEHHAEYIFDVEYVDGGLGEGSNFTHAFLPNYAPLLTLSRVVGNGDEQNSPTQILMDLFTAQDQRKDITVGVPGGYLNANGVFVKLPSNTSQTFTKKYVTPTTILNDSKANWKVIRYADVLLMLAESLNENGKTAQALPLVNQVRQRAGVPAYSGLTRDDLREKIYLERRLELSFEGHRWFDLLRTGRTFSTMKDKGMLNYMTVFPLPLSQVQLINNPAVLPQNEGYN